MPGRSLRSPDSGKGKRAKAYKRIGQRKLKKENGAQRGGYQVKKSSVCKNEKSATARKQQHLYDIERKLNFQWRKKKGGREGPGVEQRVQ